MADLLSEDAITGALSGLPAWEREDDATIARFAKLPGFTAAIEVVREVADLAEADQHHPDIDIRYNSVKFTLSTHSEGGLTTKDTGLAAKIDAVVAAHGG